jgi:hypothetical protein
MRKLLLAVLVLLWPSLAWAQGLVGPPNQILCNKIAIFFGVSAVTSLVSAVSGQTVYVCGWHVTNSSATSATFYFTSGTLTTNPCDTGAKTLTPPLSVLNTSPSADHIDYAVLSSGVSQAFCVTPSATTLTGLIYYSQF